MKTIILTLLACAGLSFTASGQEVDSLKNEIKQLNQKLLKLDELELRIAVLEHDSARVQQVLAPQAKPDTSAKMLPAIPKRDLKETEKPLTGNDLIEAAFPGSWPMFGSQFRIKLGGYVKADFLYDATGTNDRTQFLMSTIPVEGTPEYGNSGYVNFFARETRFNIDVRRVTPGAVPLRMFVEGDFWSSGSQFRLRHAYITAGNFTAGQTWTTVSLLETIGNFIDFAAGDALYGGRATQIRYDHRVDEHWKLAIALEMLSYMGIENPEGLAGGPSLRLPLLAARVDYHWSTGLAILGGQVAELRWDGGGTAPNATALQASAVFGGRQYIGTNDFVTWNVSVGTGSGENIMAFAGTNANAVLARDGKLERMPAFAFVAGYMHRWSEQFASNIGYAYGWLRVPASRAPLALKEGGIGHANLFWNPIPSFTTGIEYMYGAQRTTNGALGRASRIQGMVKFSF